MDYKEKIIEAQKLHVQAKAILENSSATKEERESVPAMVARAQELKKESDELKALMEFGATLAADAAEKQNAGAQPAGNSAFKAWGDYLFEVWRAGNPKIAAPPDPRLKAFVEKHSANEKKDMSEAIGAGGGFLVPPEFDMNLRAVAAESSLIRPRATVIRMARRQINIPVLDQTTTTAGQPHWFGGMTFYWAEEAEMKTEDDPNFRQIELVAHKIIGYTRAWNPAPLSSNG